jgi:hypothetical protein
MEKKAVLTETQMSHFQSEHGDPGKNDFLLFPKEISALPEEGIKLIRGVCSHRPTGIAQNYCRARLPTRKTSS